MNLAKTFIIVYLALHAIACAPANYDDNATAVTAATPPGMQVLTLVPRPPQIIDLMKTREDQAQAEPRIVIVTPANGSTINGSTVKVKLELSGNLNGYLPHKDPAGGNGNYINVILDNQPDEAYYDLNQPFEMRNVAEGNHTLRVFPSRPWHESYKNEGAFQIAEFTVKGNSASLKPTTTKQGPIMASSGSGHEGKDF